MEEEQKLIPSLIWRTEACNETLHDLNGREPFRDDLRLISVARARENLVHALFQLNAARMNLARATGSLSELQ